MKDIRNLLYRDLEYIISVLDITIRVYKENSNGKNSFFDDVIKHDFDLTFNYTNAYENIYNSGIPIHSLT